MWFYPIIMSIPISKVPGLHGFCGTEMEAKDEGPHLSKQIIYDICDTPPGFEHPHNITKYSFEPDEDYKKITECDKWTAIVSREKIDNPAVFYWGHDNLVLSPMIICRENKGTLYPWDDIPLVKGVFDFMTGRQSVWAKPKFKEDHKNVQDLIDSFKYGVEGKPK